MNAKFKFGAKQIVLSIVALLLIVVLIVGNIVLNVEKVTLHTLFYSLTGGFNSDERGEAYTKGDALVAELVEDSAVLLRNENKALPLDATNDKENKVNLFGWNATTAGFLLSGTGSGGSPVLDSNRVTLAEAFVEAGYQYNKELLDAYATETKASNGINWVGQKSAEAMATIHNPDSSFYTAERMAAARAYSDVAIVVLARNTGENCGNGETLNAGNYKNGTWLELTDNEKLMMEKVHETFEDGKVIVLLNTTNTMELGFLEEYGVNAAMYIGPVGQSGARAIPHLLYGQKTVKDEKGVEKTVQVSPSGRTSDTYAYNYNLVDGKSYSASWTSTLGVSWGPSSDDVSIYYQEGVYLGYKWYETADAEGFFNDAGGYEAIVQYPFGYGKSYTQFKWTVLSWPTSSKLTLDGNYEVKVNVENIGQHAGKDVVELYYTPPYINGGIEKAEINLLAFAKTDILQPGEKQELTLKFSAYDLASYDDYDKNGNKFCGYELDGGDHYIKLMSDAHYAADCYDENGAVISNQYKMTCDGVKFEKDPVTGVKVENQFTGSTAYAGTPVDGSTMFTSANNKIEYLSRKDKFANYPNSTDYTCKKLNGTPNQNYQTDAWKNVDWSDIIEYGEDCGLYLVTKEDGTQAALTELNGTASAKLVPANDVMEWLWEYDSEIWDLFLNQLTIKEINSLIGSGKFQTDAIASIGKPLSKEFDGPAGFNRNSEAGANSDPQWVVFPAEILLGCSWNSESTYLMGNMMGSIAQATGLHGWYGPGLNLHRSPYYGRNFEYYSEDAVLTGKLAAECIRGAKEQNLICYMKHFVAADTGPNSRNWCTWMTEQNLRENYLRPFEIAVKEGKANAAMSGFSAIGAVWAGSNYALSTQILRNEWGFRGSMITDWYNGYMDPIRGILAGNNLWLGNAQVGLTANSSNAIQAAARQSAKDILYTYVDCYMTAYMAQGGGVGLGAGSNVHSSLFVALWVILDLLLVAGIATCVLFIIFDKKQIAAWFKKVKPVSATADAAPADSTAPSDDDK